jgi:lipoprotein-releasing system permease protein
VVRLPYFIARRYFLSKQKKNFINIISWLSMTGVAFSTAALIVVLSVFNGLESLIRSLYTSFDPQIKIEAAQGKSFELTPAMLQQIKEIEGVEIVSEVIEDYTYVRYRDADMVAIVRGVSANFIDQNRFSGHMVQGNFALWRDSVPLALIGAGVQATLSVALEEDMHALQIFYIKNAKAGVTNPASLYNRRAIRPGGVFAIEKNYDENYIFVPLEFMNDLLNYGNKRTSLEIKAKAGVPTEALQATLRQTLGSGFMVRTNEEVHQDLYRLLKLEKLFTFLALSLLIAVGSINIFFSLLMLAIDKKKDVSILFALGARPSLIMRIFLAEGALISGLGATIGLVAGGAICWAQDRFGLVGMGMENAIVSAYPVKMRWSDFAATAAVIVAFTLTVSYYPARLAARNFTTRLL